MSLYAGGKGARISKASVEESLRLADDPRFASTRPGTISETYRRGDTKELAEAAKRAIEAMDNGAEARLRQTGVILSDGRIITEEESKALGRAIKSGQASLGPAEDWRTAFSKAQVDPRTARAAGLRGDHRAASRASFPADPRASSVSVRRRLEETYAQPSARNDDLANYGDGKPAMVGDIIQNRRSQILGEVRGATSVGVKVDMGDMGTVIVPFESLVEYTLMGRAK